MVLPRPSAEAVRRGLIWALAALATYLLLRWIMPARPASSPVILTACLMLLAALAWTLRGRLFGRSTAFALVGLAAWLFAWNRGAPMLYAFTAGCFAIVLVSHLLPRWALRRIEGRLQAPAWVSHGDRTELYVTAANPAQATIRMLELEVPIGGALPPEDRARALLVQLPAGASLRLRARTPPMRRGRRFVGPLSVRTGFPLGLAFAELGVAQTGQHVWVYPRLFPVAFVPIAGEQFLDHGGTESSRSGGVEEFAGVREYRQGDSRRHVHWRASARRGELVVKEFTRRSAATVTLALDLRASASFGEGFDTTTEAVLSAAASIARHALEHGHHVQLVLGGDKLQVHGPYRGAAALEPILRVLALAEAAGETQPGTWLSGVASVAPPESTVVLVFVDRELGPLGGLARMEARGILVVPVPVNAESYGAQPVPADKLPARARARTLRRGEDFSAAFRK